MRYEVFGLPDGVLMDDIRREINKRHAQENSTINYTMTPDRFVLEIPVSALANLSTDAHTRMLEMLNAWILRHKPLVVKEVKP